MDNSALDEVESPTLMLVRIITLCLSVFRTSIPMVAVGMTVFANIDTLSVKLNYYMALMSQAITLYISRAYDAVNTFQIINCYTFPCKYNYYSMEKFYWLIIRTPIVVAWFTVNILYTLLVSPLIDLYVMYLSVINIS
jgi:hypothetical protein